MPVFAVMLRGENFEITLDQGPSRFGFFTTRFVRAKDEQEAEHLAVALVRKHKGLRAGTRPDSAHTPVIYLESIERRPWWHAFKKQRGLVFWDMDAESDESSPSNHFRPFEVEALRHLVVPVLGAAVTDEVVRDSELVGYEYSGCGYFLTVRHPSLPARRVVCSDPIVVGRFGDVQGGYIAFIENGELVLECYTAGAADVPADFRDRHVTIEQPNQSLERSRER